MGCHITDEISMGNMERGIISMEHTGETRSEKNRRIYDKAIETSSWTGIILFRMLMSALPESAREKMGSTQRHFDDRRGDKRRQVDKTIDCINDRKERNKAHLINISKSGMFLEVDAPFDVGQEMSFNFLGKNLGSLMRMKGRVMRRDDRGIAIRFI
jgi:hypothetical protein